MKVYVPFTEVHKDTLAALVASKCDYELVRVSGSDEAYWELLSDLWAKRETFTIVEHDVVIRPDTIDELANCSFDWCAFPIPYLSSTHIGMGCVKFGVSLMQRFPDALDRVAPISDAKHPPKHWCRLDAWLQTRILPMQERHNHTTVLGHIRSGDTISPSHGCI